MCYVLFLFNVYLYCFFSYYVFFVFFFFFSSRRRHTRCLSDWGSDVCSSDLAVDDFSDLAAGVPPFSLTFGGLLNAARWETPVSDSVPFTIPSDALPGTYEIGRASCRERV